MTVAVHATKKGISRRNAGIGWRDDIGLKVKLGPKDRKERWHMKGSAKTGMVGEEQFVVGAQHLIDFARDGMPQILSTPWLLWFLESAARNVLLPLLEPGESSVGVMVNVEHTAATPLGGQVICRARVIYADGPLISFQLEAYDEYEQVARGTHKRRVIEAARLAKRVQNKMRTP